MCQETSSVLEHVRKNPTPELVDPEPFTIFLAVIGALGSIASIAGYAEFRRDSRRQRDEFRAKNIREAGDLLMSIETDLIQMHASLQKLELILVEGTSAHHLEPTSRLPLQFGSCKPLFTYEGFRKYQDVLLETNRLVGQMLETIHKLLQRLYNVDVEITHDTYQKLLELQRKLNAALIERVTYQDGFRIYYELIAFTQRIVRDVRYILTEAMRA